jgi:hypothetical protein
VLVSYLTWKTLLPRSDGIFFLRFFRLGQFLLRQGRASYFNRFTLLGVVPYDFRTPMANIPRIRWCFNDVRFFLRLLIEIFTSPV